MTPTDLQTPERIRDENERLNEEFSKGAEKRLPVMEVFGPTIQGEGPLAGTKTMFVRFGGCDFRCVKCIEGNQRVLMADWSIKPISQVQVGDHVLGMLDSAVMHKKLVPTKVLAVANQGVKPLVRVLTSFGGRDKKGAFQGTESTGLLCTADHKLLNTKWRTDWLEAQKASGAVLRAVALYTPKEDFWVGWLHGAMMGDGSIHKFQDKWWRAKLSCGDQEIRDKAFEVLESLKAPNPHKIMHNPGNGKPLLPGVEVTSNEWVEQFKEAIDKGTDSCDYRRGWLAGFFDTDGHYDRHTCSIRIGQSVLCNQSKIDRCIEYAESLGFKLNHQQNGRLQTVIISQCMEFFTRCTPLLKRKYPKELRIGKMPRAPVSSITQAGEAEVWDITTETGNFVCEGIIVHNCDSLHAVIPQMVKKFARRLTAEEIAEELLPVMQKTGTQWVTFSGGNPCMWDLTRLQHIIQEVDGFTCVETQGTLCPDWLLRSNMVVTSPKSPGMGEKFEEDKYGAFISKLRGRVPVALKVVVFSQQDFDFGLYVGQLAYNTGVIYPGMRFFSLGNPYPPKLNPDTLEMSENVQPSELLDQLMRAYRILIEDMTCDPRITDWKFLPQLHILAWGNKACV